MLEFLRNNPLIAVAMAASLAVWVAALWTVFANGKFKRKWLWALLTLLSFSFSFPAGDHVTLSVGVPLGAVYVLLFAVFGPRAPAKPAPLDLPGGAAPR